MEMPVCYDCIRNSCLCSGCRGRLQQGIISPIDIDVASALYQINETTNISSASFEHAYDLGEYVIIFTRGDVGILVGKGGRVVAEISKKLGKRVRIAQLQQNVHKTVEDFITPAQLIGINIVYSSGEKGYKVRIAQRDRHKIRMNDDTLSNMIALLVGTKNIKISFE